MDFEYSFDNPPVLVLPCSAKKLEGHKNYLAGEIYQGSSVWGLLRSRKDYQALKNSCQIVIISAKYGVLDYHNLIQTYEQSMTTERIATLSHDKRMINRFRDRIPRQGQKLILALPKAYRQVVESWLTAQTKCEIVTFEDGSGIGKQRQQLSRWADRLVAAYEEAIQVKEASVPVEWYIDTDREYSPQLKFEKVAIGQKVIYENYAPVGKEDIGEGFITKILNFGSNITIYVDGNKVDSLIRNRVIFTGKKHEKSHRLVDLIPKSVLPKEASQLETIALK